MELEEKIVFPNGLIVWEGDSLLEPGTKIVAILTNLESPSANRKTGPIVQSWILCSDLLPTDAIASKSDSAICGNCPLRRNICYVNIAPVNNLWRKYQEGGYPVASDRLLQRFRKKQQMLRLGAYGDPVAVPLSVWKPWIDASRKTLGYTHQWRHCNPEWRNYLMASVETKRDAILAGEMGWKTYRIASQPTTLRGEIRCPHQVNEFIQCVTCGLCDGQQQNIVVTTSGLDWKKKNFAKLENNMQEDKFTAIVHIHEYGATVYMVEKDLAEAYMRKLKSEGTPGIGGVNLPFQDEAIGGVESIQSGQIVWVKPENIPAAKVSRQSLPEALAAKCYERAIALCKEEFLGYTSSIKHKELFWSNFLDSPMPDSFLRLEGMHQLQDVFESFHRNCDRVSGEFTLFWEFDFLYTLPAVDKSKRQYILAQAVGFLRKFVELYHDPHCSLPWYQAYKQWFQDARELLRRLDEASE